MASSIKISITFALCIKKLIAVACVNNTWLIYKSFRINFSHSYNRMEVLFPEDKTVQLTKASYSCASPTFAVNNYKRFLVAQFSRYVHPCITGLCNLEFNELTGFSSSRKCWKTSRGARAERREEEQERRGQDV